MARDVVQCRSGGGRRKTAREVEASIGHRPDIPSLPLRQGAGEL